MIKPIISNTITFSIFHHKKQDVPAFSCPYQLVTQTDAFEDFINTFSVVNRVEDFIDFFLSEA